MSNATLPLSSKEKIGYGLGDAASNFFFHTFNIILMYYYTDVFGIAAAAAGTMFFVTKIVDTFTDPIMGAIADRTRSRWGRYRPYILFGAVPYGIIGYLMFLGPDLSESGKLAYAYLTYSLMMLAYTVINVPYSSLLGVISPDSSERDQTSSIRFVCAFGAQLLISAFVFPLKEILGGGDETVGYQRTMAIFAVLSTTLWLYTFVSTKERVAPPKDSNSNLKEELKSLFLNRPWVALVIAGFLTLMNVAVRNGATIFFIKNYVVDSHLKVFWLFDRVSFFFITGTTAMIIGSFAAQYLTKRFEKRSLMIILTALNGLTMCAFFFIPADQYWTMIAVNTIGTLIVGPTPAIVWAMYADIADYETWKTGRRTTGLVFSGAMFAQKSGLAVGAGLAGWILGYFGYVAGTELGERTIFGIRLLFSVIPGVFTLLAAFVICFYTIDRKLIKRMEVELSALKPQ